MNLALNIIHMINKRRKKNPLYMEEKPDVIMLKKVKEANTRCAQHLIVSILVSTPLYIYHPNW